MTYDLILFVAKKHWLNSNPQGRNSTNTCLVGEVLFSSPISVRREKWGSKSQRGAVIYESGSPERWSAAATTCWTTNSSPGRRSSSRSEAYLRFSSTVGLHSPARHISMSLADTVVDTRWQSGFCKCFNVAYKTQLEQPLVLLQQPSKMSVCLQGIIKLWEVPRFPQAYRCLSLMWKSMLLSTVAAFDKLQAET